MTAQISDTLFYKGEQYSIIGLRGDSLVTPEQFGMAPEMMHTACYRGYYSTYELTEKGLFLREITLRERNSRYRVIDGVEPTRERDAGTYTGLEHHVSFSGEIRFAKDFIRDLYVHMGFQKASAFETVYDATLEDGKLVSLVDRSEEMRKKRGAFKRAYESNRFSGGIDDAFSLDMDLE